MTLRQRLIVAFVAVAGFAALVLTMAASDKPLCMTGKVVSSCDKWPAKDNPFSVKVKP